MMSRELFDENEAGSKIILEEEESSDTDDESFSDDEEFEIIKLKLKYYDEFNKKFPFFIEKSQEGQQNTRLLRMIRPDVYQLYKPEEGSDNIFVSHRMHFRFDSPTFDELKQVRCQDLSDHLKGPDELKVKLVEEEHSDNNEH